MCNVQSWEKGKSEGLAMINREKYELLSRVLMPFLVLVSFHCVSCCYTSSMEYFQTKFSLFTYVILKHVSVLFTKKDQDYLLSPDF